MSRITHTRVSACAALAGLIAAACGSDKVTPPATALADVYTAGSTFSPFTTTIAAGGTVQFHISRSPEGDGHNVIFNHEAPGAPLDIDIVNNPEVTVISRVFPTRGTFSFICTVHPGMAGEVDVQ